ncbi:unnamed protein product [Leptidea sinapis]|uniref:Uncharacterized protein n=1 Tax=Leptidea sinapis TaxID=189913 RepID=A0A5E4PMJ1_9NEOP|nr:unnamed protein product [Leptidea sinapis]
MYLILHNLRLDHKLIYECVFELFIVMYSLPLRSNLVQPKYISLGILKWTCPNFLRHISVKHVLTNNECGCPGATAAGGQQTSGDGKSKHQVVFSPYQEPVVKPHDIKNMELKRPMSPHLTIYAPTMPAMTSILERITGLILVFYTVMLGGGSLFLSNGVETYVSMIQSLDLSRPSIFIIKILLGFPFTFHYFNGIRFVMWNAGKWLSMKEVYDSAKKLSYFATAALTVMFALL